MIPIEEIAGEEWAQWYRMSPREKWRESLRLFEHYLLLGGTLDPEPDTQSPFVLSTIRKHRVRCLLMGGQACVLYGAAEFSRDTDLAFLATDENLDRLRSALDELQASVVAAPPFERQYLERGHAVPFRCRHPDPAGMRIGVMSRMRGVDRFEDLWRRRTAIETDELAIDLLSLLMELAENHRDAAERLTGDRPLLRVALEGDCAGLERELEREERRERDRDREYWEPLREELRALREARRAR